ncbi:Pleckstrin homology domain-containing protein [Calycina marina]|uniref:Pleckstrin homology domain-containing protein n=1 Tax=Calycina marina TaxID=1763456 RepID=A0A9P7ZCJ2_9HELO|nr:Pleckstrin homology domain-containing protein [Calycina marina]
MFSYKIKAVDLDLFSSLLYNHSTRPSFFIIRRRLTPSSVSHNLLSSRQALRCLIISATQISMSGIPKTIEEPTTAVTPTEAPVVTEPVLPSEEVKPTEPVSTETTPAVANEASPTVVEEAAKPAAEEVKPVEEGVLGYKGPGLLKSLFFSDKFFWFGSEPVEEKHLSNYLRGEKSGEHNAAWASHTGKGLLFFSKKASDKATPASIINLADVSEVTADGADKFHFLENGHIKHAFEAKSAADRDNWVAQITAKSAEAKDAAPAIKEHETYKSTLGKLKAPVVAASAPKKSTEVKEIKEEKAEAKEEKKEEKAEAKEDKKVDKLVAKTDKKEDKEEKKERKDRSASRKRNSIFGAFGKKEEKAVVASEAPKEEAVVAAPAEPVAEAGSAPTAETLPAAAEEISATPSEARVVEASPVAAEKPANKKRNSIFGTFKSYVSEPKVKKEEAAPVVLAKDVVEPEPVSETAPVIPAVGSTEPIATVASPATAPAESTVTNGETKAAAELPSTTTKSDKRKSSLPWLSKKDKSATTSDEEGEKPKSPFLSRVVGTMKGKKAEKSAEKSVETAPETADETVPATTTEEPVVAASEPEPTTTAPVSNPTVSAAA